MSIDLERAELLLELNRAGEAETIVRAALVDDPASSAALVLLTRSLLRQQRFEEALTAARAVTAGAPADEVGHSLAVVALQNLGRREEAVDAAQVAVRCAPDVWGCRIVLGFALLSSGRRRDAKAALAEAEQAIRLAPHEADPHHLAGMCLRCLGRPKAASAQLREAARLEPGHVGAIGELAEMQVNQIRFLAAGRTVTSGLASDPHDAALQRGHDSILMSAVALVYLVLTLGGALLGSSYAKLTYPARLGIAGAMLAVCTGTLLWVARDLPQGHRAWSSLYRRSPRPPRVLLGLTLASAVEVAVIGVLPTSLDSVALAMSWGLLAPLYGAPLVMVVAGFARVIRRSGR